MNRQKRPNPLYLDLEEDAYTGAIRIQSGRKIAEAYVEVDGYWVIDGNSIGPGAISESTLTFLLWLLKDVNAAWDAEVQSFFKEGNA